MHNNTTVLNIITSQIANGFNKQRTYQLIVAALDLPNTFNDHSLLINDIMSYLQRQQIVLNFTYYRIKMGVPQMRMYSVLFLKNFHKKHSFSSQCWTFILLDAQQEKYAEFEFLHCTIERQQFSEGTMYAEIIFIASKFCFFARKIYL